jgi:hypothetical protein
MVLHAERCRTIVCSGMSFFMANTRWSVTASGSTPQHYGERHGERLTACHCSLFACCIYNIVCWFCRVWGSRLPGASSSRYQTCLWEVARLAFGSIANGKNQENSWDIIDPSIIGSSFCHRFAWGPSRSDERLGLSGPHFARWSICHARIGLVSYHLNHISWPQGTIERQWETPSIAVHSRFSRGRTSLVISSTAVCINWCRCQGEGPLKN